jgi:hypothetical protein
MNSAHKGDLVNAKIPRRLYLLLSNFTTEVPKCKLQIPAAEMAESFSLSTSAACYKLYVIKCRQ